MRSDSLVSSTVSVSAALRGSMFCLVALLLPLGACAPSEPAPGTDAGPSPGADGGGGGGGRFECCINDVGYRCPSEAAVNQCAGGFDPRCFERCTTPDCFDACIRMMEETMPDPSACTEDRSVTCEPIGGVCIRGNACDLDSDCSSDNCSGGYCYDNDVGCPCDLDSDCTSDNCSGGECRGNGVGSACDLDSDCTSGNCSGGECQGNGFGSPCDLDSDCDSGNCSGGTCQ